MKMAVWAAVSLAVAAGEAALAASRVWVANRAVAMDAPPIWRAASSIRTRALKLRAAYSSHSVITRPTPRIVRLSASQAITTTVQKMQLFTADITLRDDLLGALTEKYPQFAVTTSLPNNIEINSRLADKGRALLILAKRLGIRREETMAFGDGINDLTMIRTAGTGAAMENARAEVKRAADISAPDCNHDGVARVIETILKAR